ncbi:AIPR family protein [Candidatus Albibeggiatoa sp. nov. BB20]|uniref:AIPR family protein n=1 Tax=Candidatus Albibeggiatoa sp. nov. BB20 TaxID=3162723 RepID=UPI003365543C
MIAKDFFKIIKKFSLDKGLSIEEGFPLWAISTFYPRLNEDEIYECVRGLDVNDDSIDAFFEDTSNKELVFFQFKSVKSEKSFSTTKKQDLAYFYNVNKNLKNTTYIDNHKNSRIREIAERYAICRKKKYTVRMIFAALGGKLENESIIDSFNEADDVTFEYFGIDHLIKKYKEYESLLSLEKLGEFTLTIKFNSDNQVIQTKIGSHRTLVSILTADELIRLREEHGFKLFDKNIRYSLGENKVNKQIIDTATSAQELFYFYNNGITITCEGFRYHSNTGKIHVTLPQIINGAQTVDSIYSAYKKMLSKAVRKCGDEKVAQQEVYKDFSRLKVMFRLIKSEKNETVFEKGVIEYNNTQNSVKSRDFYSNKKEQLALQKAFSEEGYFYEIKRGERKYITNHKHFVLGQKLQDFQHKTENLHIEKLVSLYQAYLGKPSSKDVGAKYILDNEDDVYGEIFDDDTPSKVKELILAYELYDIIERESKNYSKLIKLIMTDNDYQSIKSVIENSLIFNSQDAKDVSDDTIFQQKKIRLYERIKKNVIFTESKYFILALMASILVECDYINSIIDNQRYNDKEFIKKRIVKAWLPKILKMLVVTYNEAYKLESLSTKTFLLRHRSFEKCHQRLEELPYDEDKEMKELFPIDYQW